MGPVPRRTLATACGLASAKRLEVTAIPTPPPLPSWELRARRRSGAAADATCVSPFARWPPGWGAAERALATWGTKVAFPVASCWTGEDRIQDPVAGVAAFDVADASWATYGRPGVRAMALGPEGIFVAGGGRVTLMAWAGNVTWDVPMARDAHQQAPYVAHLALGGGRLGGITSAGDVFWWDRATGGSLGRAFGPCAHNPGGHFVRLSDGYCSDGRRPVRLVVWSDDRLEEMPEERDVNEGYDADSHVGDQRLMDLRSGPSGVVSGHAPAGVRWRPSLDAPAEAAETWPEARPCSRTVVQQGSTLLWQRRAPGTKSTILVRAHRGTAATDDVATLDNVASPAVCCGGAYYLLDTKGRGLIRVGPAQVPPAAPRRG